MTTLLSEMDLPDEVVEVACKTFYATYYPKAGPPGNGMQAAIHAALLAWPGCYQRMIEDDEWRKHYSIVLPIRLDNADECKRKEQT